MTRFEELLGAIKYKNIYIQTHNFPDPDAIASAYGLSNLLKSKNIDSTICYWGVIDRCNTAQMINALGITLLDSSTLPPLNSDDEVIFVDAQKGNSNISSHDVKLFSCIDHHPFGTETSYIFKDIRPETGACSSIIAEYYFDNNIKIDSNTATALLYGIKIDTNNLTRGVSELDLDMMYRLYKYVDKDILQSLEHNSIEISDLHAYSNAIDNIQIHGDISFANTGCNCPEALIATISDFMLSLSNIHLSVVYSTLSTGIKLSIRSDDTFYDSGKICKNALAGIGNGGGHSSMAGGFIPLDETKDMDDIIKQRFLDAAIQNKELN